jgi:hypothetical protein
VTDKPAGIGLAQTLEEKFGPVSDRLRTQVQNADPDSLLRWFRQTLSADSIDEVLR